jgi:hypothetical protein
MVTGIILSLPHRQSLARSPVLQTLKLVLFQGTRRLIGSEPKHPGRYAHLLRGREIAESGFAHGSLMHIADRG